MKEPTDISEVQEKIDRLLEELVNKKWGELTVVIKAQGGKLVYIKGGVTQGYKLTTK